MVDQHGMSRLLACAPTPADHDLIRTVIVDDDPSVAFLLATALGADGGFDVVAECGDARDGLLAIADVVPELAVIDLDLGRRDGLWLAERLRAVRSRSTVVAMVTGAVLDDRVRTLATDAGVDVVAPKRDLTRSLPGMLRASVLERRRAVHAGAR